MGSCSTIHCLEYSIGFPEDKMKRAMCWTILKRRFFAVFWGIDRDKRTWRIWKHNNNDRFRQKRDPLQCEGSNTVFFENGSIGQFTGSEMTVRWKNIVYMECLQPDNDILGVSTNREIVPDEVSDTGSGIEDNRAGVLGKSVKSGANIARI